MELLSRPGAIHGAVTMPASKSHTIRGLLVGTLADGASRLLRPLRSSDTESCLEACRALGAEINDEDDQAWTVKGAAGRPAAADHTVDVANSGTTLFLTMSVAALAEGKTRFTGDDQTRRRPAGPLMEALRGLGATARSLLANGCAPLIVGGPLKGGHVSIECPTSQYLSSLLLSCPLARGDTLIDVPLLNERPYVRMTLQWLQERGIRLSYSDDLSHFEIPGAQRYTAFQRRIPGDFSSATFFLVAAAITASSLLLKGLDMEDSQGDKAVAGMLEEMGCAICAEGDGIRIQGPDALEGADFDLNATPDALPAMAVAGCFARGTTRLINVPQARQKETDRIAVMGRELSRMGADVEELDDGLIVRESKLRGARLHGHGDHRVVMALAVAGLRAQGATVIDTAESVAVTFPNFVELMRQVGADITMQS
ncbi:MAG: 3-phosphoshikimate 1-carboxyvinyltransferase [Planctomycetes bacterium]|nr:3-phosphoshikimate 1-carboxyvinyltransferase [Planctomycetota bacterium]